MKPNKRILLLLALCVFLSAFFPAFAALADQEDTVEIPITAETALLNATGKQVGTLSPDPENGVQLELKNGEIISGIRVFYTFGDGGEKEKNDAVACKTKVSLALLPKTAPEATETQDKTPNPQEPKQDESSLPPFGWIDSTLVVAALSALHDLDKETLASRDAELAQLRSATPQPSTTAALPTPTMEAETGSGFLSSGSTLVLAAFLALALALTGVGFLAWIAISSAAKKRTLEQQNTRINEIGAYLEKLPQVLTEQNKEQKLWREEGIPKLISTTMGHFSALSAQSVRQQALADEPKQALVVEPEPVPEGEEPELLALANRLAGVAAVGEWNQIVRDAGWRAMTLRENPNNANIYIEDPSGYSIVAALMRDETQQVVYIVPSYQDCNAQEDRWSTFFSIEEDISVRNYRLDALPVMFIERGAFFLIKSKGRLTRRPKNL